MHNLELQPLLVPSEKLKNRKTDKLQQALNAPALDFIVSMSSKTLKQAVPEDIQNEIFSYLDNTQLPKLRQVNHYFKNMADNRYVWWTKEKEKSITITYSKLEKTITEVASSKYLRNKIKNLLISLGVVGVGTLFSYFCFIVELIQSDGKTKSSSDLNADFHSDFLIKFYQTSLILLLVTMAIIGCYLAFLLKDYIKSEIILSDKILMTLVKEHPRLLRFDHYNEPLATVKGLLAFKASLSSQPLQNSQLLHAQIYVLIDKILTSISDSEIIAEACNNPTFRKQLDQLVTYGLSSRHSFVHTSLLKFAIALATNEHNTLKCQQNFMQACQHYDSEKFCTLLSAIGNDINLSNRLLNVINALKINYYHMLSFTQDYPEALLKLAILSNSQQAQLLSNDLIESLLLYSVNSHHLSDESKLLTDKVFIEHLLQYADKYQNILQRAAEKSPNFGKFMQKIPSLAALLNNNTHSNLSLNRI